MTFRRPIQLVLGLFIALSCASCSEANKAAPTAQKSMPNLSKQAPAVQEKSVPVQVFGALFKMMHQGELGSRVAVNDVLAKGVYGVGALSELRGEVTLVDGVAWLSYPEGRDGTRTLVTKDSAEGAALLVTGTVAAWTMQPLDRAFSQTNLAAHIATAAKAQGLDTDRPFPFLIEGRVKRLVWHVIDGTRLTPEMAKAGHASHLKAAVTGTLTDRDIQIIGFYSTKHRAVFTHHDSDIHLHLIDRVGQHSGHIDAVDIEAGAILKLPVR